MVQWCNIPILFLILTPSIVLSELKLISYEEPTCDYPGVNIDLSHLGLKVLRKKLTSSLQVSCLSLSGNILTAVSEEVFREMPNLSYLNLAGNCFHQTSINVSSSIKTLILDDALIPDVGDIRKARAHHCNITIEDSPSGYFERILELKLNSSSLEKLYLRNNELTGLILNSPGPNLTHLYLENNRMNNDNLTIPSTITNLFLSDNFISTFGQLYIEGLEVLVLDNNNIRIFCITDRDGPCSYNTYDLSLSKAGKLKALSLAGNDVVYIEYSDFSNRINLEYLDLSRNPGMNIAIPLVTKFRSLRTLLLDDIGAFDVPDLTGLEKLETLTLRGNLIRVISGTSFQSLFGYQKLKSLNLADNLITSIESSAFDQLKLLEEIDVSGNRLTALDVNWIGPHMRLRCLRLDHNSFTSIKNMGLANHTSISYLNIANNPFGLLSASDFQTLPAMGKVIIKRQAGSDDKVSSVCN